jgi:prepilin-type N-terminal cleavage/methylation domain-containing protein
MKKKKKIFSNKNGYTLIELMVALSIFVTVIVIVLGLFSMAIKGQRKVISQQNVQENASFLMEFMAKEIRMSKINGSNGTFTTLALTRSDGINVVYNISGGKISRNDGTRDGQVSADEVIVTGSFYIEGVGAGAIDNQQPKVTIVLKIQGVGNKVEEKSEMHIQYTLSQRNLDI